MATAGFVFTAGIVTGKAQMTLTGTLTDRHIELLQKRGLDPELAAKHGWTSGGLVGADGITIPYLMDGKVVNRKYRTLAGEKRFSQDPDAVKCLWNIDILKDKSLLDQPVIITEGEMDALAAIQCGFPRTLSVPDGAPSKPLGGAEGPKYSYIEDAISKLRDATIILATDGDGPGANLFLDLVIRLGRERCKFLTYPFKKSSPETRCKDLNEVLGEWGREGVEKTIARASWAQMGGIYKMSELPPLPEMPVMELGFGSPLDDHVKARRGDFWIVTGMPGGGKTTFITDALCRLSETNNLRVAWASFENLPQQDLRRQLRKWHIAKQRWANGVHATWENPHQALGRWSQPEVQIADEWIDQRFRFLVPDEEADEDPTMDWLFEKVTGAVIREGCDVVIIDPWNELQHTPPQGMTLTEYVGNAIKAIKRRARKLQVLWIVIAHPAKVKSGDSVSLYSISDSAHWFNKPDIGLIMNRGAENGDAELVIAKARYEEIGCLGRVALKYNKDTRRYATSVEIGEIG